MVCVRYRSRTAVVDFAQCLIYRGYSGLRPCSASLVCAPRSIQSLLTPRIQLQALPAANRGCGGPAFLASRAVAASPCLFRSANKSSSAHHTLRLALAGSVELPRRVWSSTRRCPRRPTPRTTRPLRFVAISQVWGTSAACSPLRALFLLQATHLISDERPVP